MLYIFSVQSYDIFLTLPNIPTDKTSERDVFNLFYFIVSIT